MKIENYVKKNFSTLPKSNFNNEEVVMVLEISNSDEGYGHHHYEGVGVDAEGKLRWCYSSGCSCNGSCGAEHKTEFKNLVVEGYDLSKIDWKEVDFQRLQVSYSDY